MHKSRLSNIIIDCRTDDIDAAARFWAAHAGADGPAVLRRAAAAGRLRGKREYLARRR